KTAARNDVLLGSAMGCPLRKRKSPARWLGFSWFDTLARTRYIQASHKEIYMFKREDFDYQISSAERYAASADENPENTKMALFHMIEAIKYLADSCENDQ